MLELLLRMLALVSQLLEPLLIMSVLIGELMVFNAQLIVTLCEVVDVHGLTIDLPGLTWNHLDAAPASLSSV